MSQNGSVPQPTTVPAGISVGDGGGSSSVASDAKVSAAGTLPIPQLLQPGPDTVDPNDFRVPYAPPPDAFFGLADLDSPGGPTLEELLVLQEKRLKRNPGGYRYTPEEIRESVFMVPPIMHRGLNGATTFPSGGLCFGNDLLFDDDDDVVEIVDHVSFFPDKCGPRGIVRASNVCTHADSRLEVTDPIKWAQDVLVLLEKVHQVHILSHINSKSCLSESANHVLGKWEMAVLDPAIAKPPVPELLDAYKFIKHSLHLTRTSL